MKANEHTDKGPEALKVAKDQFIAHWGAIGGTWGINRTMAQIHALLLSNREPMSTDEIMEELRISRGNANTNLRDLVGWGLIRVVVRKGERKEYFEAERDIWKMFCTIARERKRREIAPAIEFLERCKDETATLTGAEAKEFQTLLGDLGSMLRSADNVLDKIAASEHSKFMKWAQKLIR